MLCEREVMKYKVCNKRCGAENYWKMFGNPLRKSCHYILTNWFVSVTIKWIRNHC